MIWAICFNMFDTLANAHRQLEHSESDTCR